jgi:hypothetical protein
MAAKAAGLPFVDVTAPSGGRSLAAPGTSRSTAILNVAGQRLYADSLTPIIRTELARHSPTCRPLAR